MSVSPTHLQALAALLKERVGLDLPSDGTTPLLLALQERLGPSPDAVAVERYIERLRAGSDELRRILPLVTVGKTSFFRDERQFSAFESLLPELAQRARVEGRPLSIWSAGCATGEEPYSIAMALSKQGLQREEVEVLATDVNSEAVARAMAGRFTPDRMADVPEPLRSLYFEVQGGEWVARPSLRNMVGALRVHNLHGPQIPLPAAGAWDVIFCRNVLIYFDLEAARAVLQRFFNGLRPGGWLLLGYSESLFRLFEEFELVQVGESFLYRKPEGLPLVKAEPATPEPTVRRRPNQPPPPPKPKAPAPPPVTAPPAPALAPLERATTLMDEGRFEEARVLLEEERDRRPEDLGIRLTLANLFVLLRRPEEAEACYVSTLEREPLLAEARLFYGMHLLDEGEYERAAQELTRATFLDPDLALAHFFLGRCKERQGDVVGARRSYRNALRSADRSAFPRPLVGYYPDLPKEPGPEVAQAAINALAAL